MMLLAANTPAVLLNDRPSTSRAAMPFGGVSGERADNNLMRETDNDVNSNGPEPDFMDDESVLSITNNANGGIVIENSNNR